MICQYFKLQAISFKNPIGKAGAINSAYLAMQILALENDDLRVKLREDRIVKAKKVEMDSMEIESIIEL